MEGGRKTRRRGQRSITGFFVIVAAMLAQTASVRAESPLADRIEAVIVPGRELPASMLGAPISSYRVLSDTGSGLAAIPFQMDERDPNGHILVTEGPQPDRVDGKFNQCDELVFMAKDAGPAVSEGAFAGCEKTTIIVIKDKKTGARGEVLLASCKNPPPLSDKSYIKITPNPYTVKTDRYGFGWHERLVFAYDYITINNGPDLLDRLRVRATVGKWGVTYTFDEDHFHYSLRGYNRGPVRVSWRADNYWSLGPLGRLDVPQEIHFYPESLIMQNVMDLSMNPALVGLDLWIEIGNDMSIDPRRGYIMCANVLPQCRPLKGTIKDDDVRDLTEKKMEWGGVYGPEGGVMIHLLPDPDLNIRIKGKLTFDENFSDPPEYIKGSMPRMSFYLVDWKDVKAEKYSLDFYFYFLNTYSSSEYRRFDRATANLLAVSTRK